MSSTSDPVGTALASIAAGATTGAAVITAGAFVLRLLQRRSAQPLDQDVGFAVMTASTLGGLAAAVASGWLRSRPIEEPWRRGVVATLSVFGAVLLGLIAAPADMLAGPPGLGAYLALLIVGLLVFHRAAARTSES